MNFLSEIEKLPDLAAKFVHTFLPTAKKPYYLRPVHQKELEVHDAALKAEVYTGVPAKTIEDGFTALLKHLPHLLAEGYSVKTPLFKICMRVPGEYDGTEEHVPAGTFPVVRLHVSSEFKQFAEEHIHVLIDGFDEKEGHIGEIVDEATGLVDECFTVENVLTIRGSGLKIESDEAHKEQTGVFFDDRHGNSYQARLIAVNEPRTLKVVPPGHLLENEEFYVRVATQGSAKNSSTHLLKEPREVRSEFLLTCRK